MSALGVTAGAHRLWSHRSYKARSPLKIILALWNAMAFQVRFYLMFLICLVLNRGSECYMLSLVAANHENDTCFGAAL